MALPAYGPRKQRTRQHIIADLSLHYLEGFILESGHTFERVHSDYGYDLRMQTFDEFGYVEPGIVCFQCKAAEELESIGANFVYDLSIRDYHLFIHEEFPVILVLFDATRRQAFWVLLQEYFGSDASRHPKVGTKTVRSRALEDSRYREERLPSLAK